MVTWTQIKNYNVPIQLLVYMLVAAFWVEGRYMSVAAAENNDAEIMTAVQGLSKSVETHISTYELNRVRDKIEQVQQDQFDLSQWVKVNTATEQSAQQEEKLRVKLMSLEKQENCIITGSELCG